MNRTGYIAASIAETLGRMTGTRFFPRRPARIGAPVSGWVGPCPICGWPELTIAASGGKVYAHCACPDPARAIGLKKAVRAWGRVYDAIGGVCDDMPVRADDLDAVQWRLFQIAFAYCAPVIYIVPVYPGLSEDELIELRFPGGRPTGRRVLLFVDDPFPPDGVAPTWALDHRRGTRAWSEAYGACRIAARDLAHHVPPECLEPQP